MICIYIYDMCIYIYIFERNNRCRHSLKQAMKVSWSMISLAVTVAHCSKMLQDAPRYSKAWRLATTIPESSFFAPPRRCTDVMLTMLTLEDFHSFLVFSLGFEDLSSVASVHSRRQVTHRLAIIFGLSGLKFAEIHGNLSQAVLN